MRAPFDSLASLLLRLSPANCFHKWPDEMTWLTSAQA